MGHLQVRLLHGRIIISSKTEDNLFSPSVFHSRVFGHLFTCGPVSVKCDVGVRLYAESFNLLPQFPHMQYTKPSQLIHSPSFRCTGEDNQFREEERATYHDRRHGEEVRSLSSWPGPFGELVTRVVCGSVVRLLAHPSSRRISRSATLPLAHKVVQTKPRSQFSLLQLLLSHLFLRSNPLRKNYLAKTAPYKTYLSTQKKKMKKFGRSRPAVGSLPVCPCGAFGPARCSVAAQELSSQSWDQSAETARRISLRGAPWLVPRSKKVVGGEWGAGYVRWMLDCFSWENSCWN